MTDHHTSQRADIVVVGAGMAGLTCANALLGQGADVLVLEARDHVGGRTRTVEAGGESVDLGGQFIGPGQDRAYALAGELGIEVFATYNAGDHLMETAAGGVRPWRGTVPKLSVPEMLDLAQAMARFERLARTIDPDSPWSGSGAAGLDGQTLAGWLRRTHWTKGGRELFTAASRLMWACEPGELSLLHALFYARAAGGLNAVMATEGGAQQDRLDGGAGEMARRLAARLGDRIRLAAPVHRIARDASHVVVTTGSGQSVRADQVVVAIPPTLAGRVLYDPPLPAARDRLTQRLPMGGAIKCVLVYGEPFWRAAGLSGQAISMRGPVDGVADSSPRAGGRGVLVAVLHRPASQAAVLEQLTRLFGAEAGRPIAWVQHDWSADPFSRGGYAALFPPHTWTRYGPAVREPVDRIHWAGSETATRWYGYIDGAIRSGEAAAEAVLARR
ncbi:flavin monoamine oxidase family protein [Nonomuraea sp. NPDC050540]|uniref:flavin monoamine oxidase family protein n=1 Tax=Nonomuraea sp. NPDC050540 TaxID=3364367 RepID=UPI00378FE778